MATKSIDEMYLLTPLAEAAFLWCRDPRSIARSIKRKRIRTRRARGVLLLSYRDLVRAYGEPPNGIRDQD